MKFKLALAQISSALGNLEANMEKHVEMIRRASAEGANLVIFPELSLSGYLLRDLTPDLALDPECSTEMMRLASVESGAASVVGFVEQSQDYRFFNSVAYLNAGRVQQVHRKVYLPTYGMFDEKRFFASGETLRTVDSRWGKLGLLICEDIWHFSTTYLLAHQGALMIIASSAGPARGVRGGEALGSAASWDLLARSIAQFNTVFFVTVNRVGFEDGMNFFGGSLVVDPYGNVIARAKTFDEDLVVVEIDFERVRRARAQSPLLRDEKMELTLRELERISRNRFLLDEKDVESEQKV